MRTSRARWFALLLLAALTLLLNACNPNAAPRVVQLEAQALNYAFLLYWEVSDPDGEAVSCSVDFGDGSPLVVVPDCEDVKHASHVYAQDGKYQVTFIARDTHGTATEKTLTVAVPKAPENACTPPGSASLEALPQAALPTGLGFKEGLATVPGKLLVRAGDAASLKAALQGEAGLKFRPAAVSGWYRVEVPPGAEKQYAEKLLASGAAYVQPVYRYRPVYIPNDPLFEDYQQAQYAMMNLTDAWDLLFTNACRPIVAVVDSGADYDHEDLGIHLLPGYDFSDDDPDASYEPASGEHGTMVAGVVGAVTNNKIGVAGSSNNLAYVLPLKVFNNGTSETIAEAIDYATDVGAHVINLSLCLVDANEKCADLSEDPDPYIEEALKNAAASGLIAVAASGNDGEDYVGYPASSTYTIAVGAVDNTGARAEFSNYGTALDFVAPGVDVATTYPGDAYYGGDGTSFATPYVAGILTLYVGQYATLLGNTPDLNQALGCLEANTNQDSWNEETGYGIPLADEVLDTADNNCYPDN